MQLVLDRTQEAKRINNNFPSPEFEKELEDFISISPTDILSSLSQKCSTSQSLNAQQTNDSTRFLIPTSSSSSIHIHLNPILSPVSKLPTTNNNNNNNNKNTGSDSQPNFNTNNPNGLAFTQLPVEESNLSNHSKSSNTNKEFKDIQIIGDCSDKSNPAAEKVLNNTAKFTFISPLVTQSNGEDSISCEIEVENTFRLSHTIPTIPCSHSPSRPSIIYDTMTTQIIPECKVSGVLLFLLFLLCVVFSFVSQRSIKTTTSKITMRCWLRLTSMRLMMTIDSLQQLNVLDIL